METWFDILIISNAVTFRHFKSIMFWDCCRKPQMFCDRDSKALRFVKEMQPVWVLEHRGGLVTDRDQKVNISDAVVCWADGFHVQYSPLNNNTDHEDSSPKNKNSHHLLTLIKSFFHETQKEIFCMEKSGVNDESTWQLHGAQRPCALYSKSSAVI